MAQSKEWEEDVIYSEDKVPYYSLPDPLVSVTGHRISSVEEWKTERRPQIMGMFATSIYGRVPMSEDPITVQFEEIEHTPET